MHWFRRVVLVTLATAGVFAVSLVLLFCLGLWASGIVLSSSPSVNRHGTMAMWFSVLMWSVPFALALSMYAAGVAIRRTDIKGRRRADGLCVHCGYNLTGNFTGVCPECGERV